MASFQAKIGWIRQIKRENENCRSVPLRSAPFKKLKNINMASFQTKIGWKRLRKRENKN